MGKIDWYEIKGSPTEAEMTILIAALEQCLFEEEELPVLPSSAWVRGELPVLPPDPAEKNTRMWNRPATRRVAAAVGTFGGVAASVAIAIKMRHHQSTGRSDKHPSSDPGIPG